MGTSATSNLPLPLSLADSVTRKTFSLSVLLSSLSPSRPPSVRPSLLPVASSLLPLSVVLPPHLYNLQIPQHKKQTASIGAAGVTICTQFTCFTRTKVQILTPDAAGHRRPVACHAQRDARTALRKTRLRTTARRLCWAPVCAGSHAGRAGCWLQRPLRQYLYVCTSKASKLSTDVGVRRHHRPYPYLYVFTKQSK